MTYLPDEHLLWDFWFAPRRPDEPFHLFHLQAPRDLPDPEMRHRRASIGHAVSRDLINWEARPTALTPGPPGAWDDLAIWTGSILEHEGRYWFFYTALATADDGHVQRIGLATSADLTTWERHPENPLLVADPRWYEQAGDHPRAQVHCRDPYVVRDDEAGCWMMVYCARAKHGPVDERGVVGRARSDDLVRWTPLPPLTEPGEFGQLEVPQLVRLGARWYLLFCTAQHSTVRLARLGADAEWNGTHYLVADRLDGPYRLLDGAPLAADAAGTTYAGRIEFGPDGEPFFLAWTRFDESGRFVGGLADPIPVLVDPDGRLVLDPRVLSTTT